MLKKSLRLDLLSRLNFSMIFIFIIFIISVGVIDRSIARISFIEEQELFSQISKYIFIGIFISSVFIQSLFLGKLYMGMVPSMQKRTKWLYLVPFTFHFLNVFFVITLVTQMIVDDQYAKFLILFIIWNSVTIGILILSSLVYRLVLWIRESINKSVVVVAYSMSIISIVLLNIFVLLYFNLGYRIATSYINSTTIPSIVFSNSYGFFAMIINYISILSFFLLCGSTVLLLIRRSDKIKARHIGMIAASIIIFLSNYLFLWGFGSMRITNVLMFYDIYIVTKIIAFPIGGIFFGFTFWMIARGMKNQSQHNDNDENDFKKLKESMYLTAIGIALILFSAAPLDITRLPYPPFGLVSFTYINTGSLSLFLGIYNLALSIASSSQIRKGLHQRSDFLFSIGSSEHSLSKRKSIAEVLGSFRNILHDSSVGDENLDKAYVSEVKNYLIERKVTQDLRNISFAKTESPLGRTWESWIESWCKWYYCTREIDSNAHSKENYEFNFNKELLFLAKVNLKENDKSIEYEVSLPKGKILFMPLINNLITLHDHPEINSEEELRLFAKQDLDKNVIVFLSINNIEINDSKQFRIQSNLLNIRSPIDRNSMNASEIKAISDGYWIFVNPLSVGKNKIFYKVKKVFAKEILNISDREEVITEVTYYINIY